MRTEPIPDVPTALGADTAAAMLQRRIKKHHVAVMLLHWWNACVWCFELATGLALISSPYFRVAPRSYVSLLEGLFGGRAALLEAHVALGLLWACVLAVYGVFGRRTYLDADVLRKEVALGPDDRRWLRVRTLRILGLSREALPPQGSYNAGQKLFAFAVYALVPLVVLSGVVMAFRLFGPAVIGWAVVLHFAAAGAVVAGLMVHVYMGAVFPEEKPAFFSMLTGTVDELYAYNHHFAWWRTVKLAEREWRARHESTQTDAGVAAAAQALQAAPPEERAVPPPPSV